MSYLLDANVLSEIRRRAPNPAVEAWYDSVPSSELFLSVLTLGEIRLGIERLRRRDAAQASGLEKWLAGIGDGYRDRVVAVDVDIAEAWARLNVPDPLPVIDGLLAATAAVRGWTLVTRNTRDVGRTGVSVLNPFDPRA